MQRATEQTAEVRAAADSRYPPSDYSRALEAAREGLHRAVEERQRTQGPMSVLHDISRALESRQSAQAAGEARALDQLTAALFRSQAQLRQTMRDAGTSVLVSQIDALTRAAGSDRVAQLSSSREWQQVIGAIRSAAGNATGQRLAREIEATHPGVDPVGAAAAVLDAVVEEAVRDIGGLERAEADQIVTLGLDAIASVEPDLFAAAAASDQGLSTLLLRIIDEFSLRRVQLTPTVLAILVALITWLCPSPYTLLHDRASDREITELKEAVGRLESRPEVQEAPDRLTYQTVKLARLRERPSGKAPISATLDANRQVVQRERSGRWLHVDLVDPREGEPPTGWVYDQNLVLLPR